MRLEYSFSFTTTALPSSGWQHLHGPIQQSREGNPGTRGWPEGCVFSWRPVFSVDGVSVCSFSYTQQAKTIRWPCPGDCTLWFDLHPPGQALCIAGWWMSTKNGGSPLNLQPERHKNNWKYVTGQWLCHQSHEQSSHPVLHHIMRLGWHFHQRYPPVEVPFWFWAWAFMPFHIFITMRKLHNSVMRMGLNLM